LSEFCKTHDAATKGYDTLKEECPEIFWQGVSGSILCNKPKFELILFVPYEKELNELVAEAREIDDPKYNWIIYADKEELPYLIEGRYYKNLTHFEFDIKKEDKDFLTQRVEEAVKLLKKKQ
jgi:hypothetical protein